MPDSPELQTMGDQLTISAWIKVDPDTTCNVYDYRHIVSKGAVYGILYADYALGLSNPDCALYFEYEESQSQTRRFALPDPMPRGEWQSVAVTFNAGTIKFYVDGLLKGSFTSDLPSIRSSTQPLYIGARYVSPMIVGTFNGSIDDVLIWNRVLTSEEIFVLANPTVPTVSEWGMMAMAGLMLLAGGVVIARRRAAGQ